MSQNGYVVHHSKWSTRKFEMGHSRRFARSGPMSAIAPESDRIGYLRERSQRPEQTSLLKIRVAAN